MWDRSWCSAIGYLVRAGFGFRPEMNLLCFVLFTQVWSRTPPPSIPRGSVHVTPARRFTAVQNVLSITPAAKEEQPLSLSVAAGKFLSLCVLRSAVRAGSGHLVHVKVYKRNSRLLPLFSVGKISYLKDLQSAHAWLYRLLAWKYWDLAWKMS